MSTSEPHSAPEPSSKHDQPARSALKAVFTSRRILTLACFFEVPMYLFVFFWMPALKAAVSQTQHHPTDLPLGMIFACFMSSVMPGSLLFNLVSKYKDSYFYNIYSEYLNYLKTLGTYLQMITKITNSSTPPSNLPRTPPHPNFFVSGLSLALPIIPKSPTVAFWSFCVFEACVGIYYPVSVI